MALLAMPCAAASALKRASQLSKLPEVRQSVAAEAAVATNSAAANAGAVHRYLPIRFMIAARMFWMRSANKSSIINIDQVIPGRGLLPASPESITTGHGNLR